MNTNTLEDVDAREAAAFRAGFRAAIAATDGISVWRDTTIDEALEAWGEQS